MSMLDAMFSMLTGMSSQAACERNLPASALSYTNLPIGVPSAQNAGTNTAATTAENLSAVSICRRAERMLPVE